VGGKKRDKEFPGMEKWKGLDCSMGEMRGGRKKLVCIPFLTGHTLVAA
jgi:hypothetical protein